MCAALFGSVYVAVLCMVVPALRYRAGEVLFLGLFIDFLWQPAGGFLSPLPLFTILAAVVVWGFEPIRKRLLVR
jgi:hypothetical protein